MPDQATCTPVLKPVRLTGFSNKTCPVLLLLTCHPTGASHFAAPASGLGSAHGLATLAAAPVLSELQAWSDWDSLYGPRLGPLPAFLAQHQQQLGFRVLEVPGGGLLKLPAAPAGSKLDLQQLRSGLKLAVEQVRGSGSLLIGCCGAFWC